MLDELPIHRVVVAALAACALMLVANISSARAATSPGYVPHELIVGYRQSAVSTVTTDFESRRLGARNISSAPAPRSKLLHLRGNERVQTAAARLRREPGVAYAEPNFVAHQAGAFYPDDPGRSGKPQGWESMQWNMLPGVGVNAPEAWANLLADHAGGGRGVTVAILDTGVAYRRWHKFRESPDFRGTRFVHPYDFVAGNRYPLDRNGHGTFVAGVVAEATNNKFGLTGLAYGASIMPVRILDASGLGDESTIARGIRYAVSHGAQVINLSLEFLPNEVTSGADIPEIVSAINFAHQHGVVVVGAAGNDESNRIAYPAKVANVISVGATTRDNCLANYSNGGVGLDLVAPGGGDDAIIPTDSFCQPNRNLPPIYQLTLVDPPHWGRFGYPGYYIGTSMSAPEVAAASALVIASRVIGRHPKPAQILARLEQTATPLGGSDPNRTFGYGLLNAGAATARPGQTPPPPPAP
jgi:serine protease